MSESKSIKVKICNEYWRCEDLCSSDCGVSFNLPCSLVLFARKNNYHSFVFVELNNFGMHFVIYQFFERFLGRG